MSAQQVRRICDERDAAVEECACLRSEVHQLKSALKAVRWFVENNDADTQITVADVAAVLDAAVGPAS